MSGGENNDRIGGGSARNRRAEPHDLNRSPGALRRERLFGGEDELAWTLRPHMHTNTEPILHGIEGLHSGGEDIDEP